jgi:predicted ATPase/DNA-binding winged helix-turn-helix (wHTH) protein
LVHERGGHQHDVFDSTSLRDHREGEVPMIFAFGGHELDTDTLELRYAGAAVSIEPQVFDVLAYLVSHRDRVVSKEELLDEVWGDRFVSVSALTSRIKAARRAVGDDGHRQAVIRTVHGRGYRFVASIEARVEGDRASEGGAGGRLGRPSLPVPLTSFVGRAAERAALADAVTRHRLVTTVGPGGVGKTRLALAVAADVTGRFADGAWYVDLVPVTDPAMVGAAVAGGFGFGEQVGRSPTDTVLSKLAGSEALVVLDNCEHVVDGVTAFVERLLSACPNTTVLATSRVRLTVPFEWLLSVPGMSVHDADGEGDGDAVALFVDRAAMAGWSSPDPDDRRRIMVICAELDGVALAIELAAARLATFGLDGLEAGLGNQLALLAGGPRLDARHQSVRSALDWSVGLLDDKHRVALRRVSVFASPFTAADAAAVCGHAPLVPEEVAESLARLVDHSLLVVVSQSSRTRYRMLETIRQYGVELMAEVEEEVEVRVRHLRWCLTTAERLNAERCTASGFDEVADDLRAGLGWAAGQPQLRVDAHELAVLLAELTFAAGMPSEAQRRYEEAGTLAVDPADAARALHLGAAVAWGRAAGNEAIRLYRAAAEAARQAGDRRRAAVELATAAELIRYAPGVMSELAPPAEQQALLDEAWTLAFGDAHVEAAMLNVIGFQDERDPQSGALIERAVELARRVGDPRLESSTLDSLTGVQLAHGEFEGATATVRLRLELLTPRAHEVEMAWEYTDALHMACLVYLAAGNLEAARRFAQQRRDLPLFRETDHLAVGWLLTTAAMAGEFDEAVDLALQFRRGWIEAGRPAMSGFADAPAATAMVYGIRGDDEARREWHGISTEMRRVTAPLLGDTPAYVQVLDGLVALHRGELGDALARLSGEPESFQHWQWHDGAWRQWYTAVWAEVAVLAELADRRQRLDRARFIVVHNPTASAILDRADALDTGDTNRLLAAADALDVAGCRYQHARTLVLAGDEARAKGEAILAAIGAAPMAI